MAKKRHPWSNLNSVTQVTSERTIRNKSTKETRYFISSVTDSAKNIGHAIRSHWELKARAIGY